MTPRSFSPLLLRACPALAIVWLVLAGGAASPVEAQTVRASRHTEAVPPDLAPPVASALAPGGIRVQIDSLTIDIWSVARVAAGAETPAASGPWQQVPQGALLGAIRLSAALRDIRGRVIPAGVYTLRFGLQPANGDHLGVSAHREFVLVSPATVDRDVAPTGYDGAVERSRQSIGTSHPAVLSIDPPEADASTVNQVRTNDAGHQAVIVSVPRDGGPPLIFGLVVVGRIEA